MFYVLIKNTYLLFYKINELITLHLIKNDLNSEKTTFCFYKFFNLAILTLAGLIKLFNFKEKISQDLEYKKTVQDFERLKNLILLTQIFLLVFMLFFILIIIYTN